jgi:hypothetical protein
LLTGLLSLFYLLPSSQLNQLQIIQNSLARAVTRTPRFCHISPVLKSLHWLKIKQRIEYKIISLTYTALQHNSPSYLSQKLKIQSSRSTRSSSAVTLHRPSVKLETGKRSFTFAAPQLWNSLSTTIRQPATDPLTCRLALTRNTFHKHLKTHLICTLISTIIFFLGKRYYTDSTFIATWTLHLDHQRTHCHISILTGVSCQGASELVRHYSLDLILAPSNFLLTYYC